MLLVVMLDRTAPRDPARSWILAGWSCREYTPSRSRTNTLAKLRLARYSQQLMDELANREGLQYWQTHNGGLRPMTPDGPPLIGLGRHDNLYYNTGHGHVGWTMACGSARMLADLIDERCPDIDPTPYSPINRNRHR